MLCNWKQQFIYTPSLLNTFKFKVLRLVDFKTFQKCSSYVNKIANEDQDDNSKKSLPDLSCTYPNKTSSNNWKFYQNYQIYK